MTQTQDLWIVSPVFYSLAYHVPVGGRHLCRDPSYGQVKHTVDGCLFVWTGIFFFLILMSPVRRTDQNALHVMLLSYCIGMSVFHEHQRDICRCRTYSQGFAKAVHMSNDRQHFDPA